MALEIYKRFKQNPLETWKKEGESEKDWKARINPGGVPLQGSTLKFLRGLKDGQTVGQWKRRFTANFKACRLSSNRSSESEFTKMRSNLNPDSSSLSFSNLSHSTMTESESSAVSVSSESPVAHHDDTEPSLHCDDLPSPLLEEGLEAPAREDELEPEESEVSYCSEEESGEDAGQQEDFDQLTAGQSPIATSSISSLTSIPHSSPRVVPTRNTPIIQRSPTPTSDHQLPSPDAEAGVEQEELLFAKLQDLSAAKTRDLRLKSDRITELECDKAALETVNNELQDQLQQSLQELNDLKAQMERKENKFYFEKMALENENDKLKSELQRGEQKHHDLKDEMEKKLEVLESRLTLATNEGDKERSAKARLQQVVNNLTVENTSLSAEKVRLVEERERNDEEKMKALQAFASQLFPGKTSHPDVPICSAPPAKRRRVFESDDDD
ncbi:hypothetical protein Moror_4196 [Moniliophthora roreri MCA 2997]|uniref:Uncharacterized protein n=2 Tax=Moniliophthora roreri TaxID=221103 RepID=V2XA88_MONRO|nr:hypothetical protein Moror_4196 [Moniliophthora roreri MCA 2997]KAI3597491.1 hypothetical protein WG66_013233 [Moniliophthora roreri]